MAVVIPLQYKVCWFFYCCSDHDTSGQRLLGVTGRPHKIRRKTPHIILLCLLYNAFINYDTD